MNEGLAQGQHAARSVAIVGGGILGISLGYFLARAGVRVAIYEAGPDLGGLAGPLDLRDGTTVDRFYHAILSSDEHLAALCAEVGIADQMRFKPTRMGFYLPARAGADAGTIHSMNGTLELLRFPPLTWVDRFRLGLTVVAAQMVRDGATLDGVSVEEWLVRYSGRHAYDNLWRPMLQAKFDGGFDQVPATWIWSRLVRMKSTRKGVKQKEEAGHLIGGYPTLLRALAREIGALGGAIHLGTAVQEIVVAQGQARGLRVGGELRPYDAVVATVQTPLLARLAPELDSGYRERLSAQEYLGILCPLLVLDGPLTGYWTLNIADDSVPFTGIIETTTYIDPQYTGGHHLVYLPKYTAPGSAWQSLDDDAVQSLWLKHLRRMFPQFDASRVREVRVSRHRYVEPLHGLGGGARILPIETPAAGLYLATTAQIYPALTNGESVTRLARRAAETVLQAAARPQPQVAPAPAALLVESGA